MPKTSTESRMEQITRAHEIQAPKGGCYAGSPWSPVHEKPVPRSNENGKSMRTGSANK